MSMGRTIVLFVPLEVKPRASPRFREFKLRRVLLEDGKKPGRPIEATVPENIKSSAVHDRDRSSCDISRDSQSTTSYGKVHIGLFRE